MSSEAAHAMDAIYRHQRHVYDATRRYFLFGRDELLERLAPPAGGSVLEIGCGTARNLIKAANIYPEARFYGVDVSSEMLKTAQAGVAKNGLEDRVRVAEADAVTFEPQDVFGVERFDRIVLSYTLSMIPPWQAVIGRAIQLLEPRGQLHIVDFGMMQGLPSLARYGLRSWLALFEVTPRDDLADVVHKAGVRALLPAKVWQGSFGYSVNTVVG
jgi:S-adenosylmethionine-diacylgycerolhomoserine-N-methlytransferase